MADFIEELGAAIPPILFRNNPNFRALIGLSPRYLANLDSKGRGPKQRVRVGRNVGYPRQAILDFLAEKLEIDDRRPAE